MTVTCNCESAAPNIFVQRDSQDKCFKAIRGTEKNPPEVLCFVAPLSTANTMEAKARPYR